MKALLLAMVIASGNGVYVIDGDTIILNGIHIRLKGVDAKELHTQQGKRAKIIMQNIVRGYTITCHLTGERTRNREVGYCLTDTGLDINREIIRMGEALSCPRYSDRYLEDETEEARSRGRSSYCE
jgi:endonuclease YncB( thermonuclease family)